MSGRERNRTIGEIGRGFDNEARGALTLLASTRQQFRGKRLQRYFIDIPTIDIHRS